jgi:hypothetical protein
MCLVVLLALPNHVYARSAGIHPRSASLATLVLRQADVPASFVRTQTHAYSLTQVARLNHVGASVMRAHGFVSGYQSAFLRSATGGLLEILDDIVVYRRAAGARWQLAQSQEVAANSLVGDHLRRFAVSRIGDQTVGETYVFTAKGRHIAAYFVLFRRGAYAAYVAVVGYKGDISSPVTVRYANLMETRIAAASA